MTILLYAQSEKGKIVFNNNKELDTYLALNEGKKLVVKIDRYKAKRSLDQNAYYWVVLDLIEQETGNLASDVHEICKRKFLPPVFKTVMGETFKIPGSTTDLNKPQFGEYLDKISAWSGVPLPPIEKVTEVVQMEYPENDMKPLF